ncbi:MAG TPA: PHP domain-containing protein [Clostridia bacterium]|nr:PHP domain-containing protein [Clostridia bacterium]
MGEDKDYIAGLNDKIREHRLKSLKKLKEGIEKGRVPRPEDKGYVNNHIHTTYSFSPYSPSKALWMAYNSGLTTAGIMDHDSISGAEEFIEAGKIIGMATTIGLECRVDFSGTSLEGKRINNPDQNTIAYMALHGIPHTQIHKVKSFFAPYTLERNKRNRLMVGKINKIFKPFGIELDFNRDVIPLSQSHDGGSITERHLLFALSKKLVKSFGKTEKLLEFLMKDLGLHINLKMIEYLLDFNNEFYEYDLLGLLKSDLVEKIYIDATLECPHVSEVLAFSKNIGAISAYAYLGDVGDSVTGDKKAQRFEDEYLDLLFRQIEELGFNAVTYMPTRNTLDQLQRIKNKCREYGLFEISGEDINSPRQSFICEALNKAEFKNLIESTWALIGHEISATQNIDQGIFSSQTMLKYPHLQDRIDIYSKIGIGNNK